MAHMMKHTKASCGHMFAHFDRKAENISNENLDRERTHLNYNLATHQQMEQGAFVRQRCSEVRCQNRKDVNVMVSWVITAPKDLPEDEQPLFFKACYDFCSERYGKENVVSAYVHMDEITPHMHFAFVPVTYDEKKEIYKVSAKEVVNRNDLQKFHPDLQNYVHAVLGHEVSILNEATKEGNRSIAELKRHSASEQIQEVREVTEFLMSEAQEKISAAKQQATEIVSNAKSKSSDIQNAIKNTERQLSAMQAEINAVTNACQEMTKSISKHDMVHNPSVKEIPLTDSVVIKKSDYEALLKKANTHQSIAAASIELRKSFEKFCDNTDVVSILKELKSSKEKIKDLSSKNSNLADENYAQYRELVFLDKFFDQNPKAAQMLNIFKSELNRNRSSDLER